MPANMGDNIPKLAGRYMNIIVLSASDSNPWYNNNGKEYHVQSNQSGIGVSMCNVTHRNDSSVRLDRNAPPL